MRGAESVETRGAQVAAFTSMLLIAQQVSGKAVRDALFLSSFHATSLPLAMGLGALLSLAGVYGLSQWMARSTPAAIMPALFSVSACAFGFAWLLAQSAPRPAAALIYLQTALLNPLMLSTFWSLINERFDPHTAKRAVARISGGGTLGGVLGGLVVWRASKLVEPASVILLLAALNALALVGTLLTRARRAPAAAEVTSDAREDAPSPASVLLRAPFLRNLALLVALSAAISAMLDYLLSAEAVTIIGKGPALLSFFSLFWLGVAICSFVVQMVLGKVAIEKLSLAVNIAILPGTILLGGALGLAVPGLASCVLLRGAEAVQRNTLFRSAYELLYTPVPEASKRVTKAVIDVGFDRVGTIVGSGLALSILSASVSTPHSVLLAMIIPLALATLPLARRLHAGYVGALQEGLRVAAASVDSAGSDATRGSLSADSHRPVRLAREKLIDRLEDIQPGGLSALVDDDVAREHERQREPAQATPEASAVMLSRVRRLLSGDDAQIERSLRELDGRGPEVACAIALLAHRTQHERALLALRRVAGACTGELLDALLDGNTDFQVRRRLPRALEECRTQRAVDGLLLGLADERFEVRYACAQALVKITDGQESLQIPQEHVLRAIQREVESGQRIVERSTSDQEGDAASLEPFVAGLLEDRVDRSLEHVFRVLSLVFEREPLRLAFRALHHEDSKYRGTALEYLDSVLPSEIRDMIWPYLGAAAPLPVARPAHELLADLAAAK
jgi:ATP:ADP antiporter, AAA family